MASQTEIVRMLFSESDLNLESKKALPAQLKPNAVAEILFGVVLFSTNWGIIESNRLANGLAKYLVGKLPRLETLIYSSNFDIWVY